MAVYGERRKSVSFNLNNPTERAMFEFSQRTNFSKLVKQYLARELKRQQTSATVQPQSAITVRVGGDEQ